MKNPQCNLQLECEKSVKISDAEYYLEIRIILSLQLEWQLRSKCNTEPHIQKPHILPSQVNQYCLLLIFMHW